MNPVNAENGNFGKLTYQPEGYKETIKYITTQPLESRKNGFCSKDASRRDEVILVFTRTLTTITYVYFSLQILFELRNIEKLS